MTQPFFSICIPCYNVASYLSECFDSVLNQDFINFEIIAINDGSSDRTYELLKSYKDKDKRIILINQENQGLFHSRIIAMSQAKGEYCIFLDSDDKWKNYNVLNILYDKIIETNCDLICFEKEIYYDNGKISSTKSIFSEERVFNADNKIELIKVLTQTNNLNSIWAKSFKTNLLDFKTFSSYPKITMGEDIVFSSNLISKSQKTVYITDKLYQYRKNYSSMSYSFNYDQKTFFVPLLELKKVINEMSCCNDEMDELYEKRFLKEMAVSVMYSFSNIKGKEKEYIQMLEVILENEFFSNYYIKNKKKLNFIVKFPLKLLFKKRFNSLIKYKKILQNKFLNKFLRKLFS